jgi:hypothetical protein
MGRRCLEDAGGRTPLHHAWQPPHGTAASHLTTTITAMSAAASRALAPLLSVAAPPLHGLARRVLLAYFARLTRGSLSITEHGQPDVRLGADAPQEGDAHAVLRVRHARFWTRMLLGAEAFMTGDVECDELGEVFRVSAGGRVRCGGGRDSAAQWRQGRAQCCRKRQDNSGAVLACSCAAVSSAHAGRRRRPPGRQMCRRSEQPQAARCVLQPWLGACQRCGRPCAATADALCQTSCSGRDLRGAAPPSSASPRPPASSRIH